jgi:hypothetical protein
MKPPDRPLIRSRLEGTDLRDAWEHHAAEFVAWARTPDHDNYPQFHRELFLPLVPASSTGPSASSIGTRPRRRPAVAERAGAREAASVLRGP